MDSYDFNMYYSTLHIVQNNDNLRTEKFEIIELYL